MGDAAEASQADGGRRVSSNEIDYAAFVLYVKQGVPACEHLRRLAAQSHDVIVQDVGQIQGPRPGWLKGVPSLVRLKDYALFTGTKAIGALESHLSSGVQGIGGAFGAPGGGAAAGSSTLLRDLEGEAPAAPRGGFDLRLASDDCYADAPKEKSAGGLNLESMMRLRSSQVKPAAQQPLT
jgi:hypothetical protein